jgi:hypothetical protein
MDDKERTCAYKIISIFTNSNELDIIEPSIDENQLDIFQAPELRNPQRHMTSFEG